MGSMKHTALYEGRPQEQRAAVETACYDFLEHLGISYFRVDHEAAHTMETCREIEGTLGAPIAKNLFLCNRQKTAYYLLVTEGGKVFKTKHLSAQLGCSRLSFAPPEDMVAILGVTPGSANLLALQNDTAHRVTLVLDEAILSEPYLGLHPGQNTTTLRLATKDVLERVIPALDCACAHVTLPGADA